jgi:hypothetical protein
MSYEFKKIYRHQYYFPSFYQSNFNSHKVFSKCLNEKIELLFYAPSLI